MAKKSGNQLLSPSTGAEGDPDGPTPPAGDPPAPATADTDDEPTRKVEGTVESYAVYVYSKDGEAKLIDSTQLAKHKKAGWKESPADFEKD